MLIIVHPVMNGWNQNVTIRNANIVLIAQTDLSTKSNDKTLNIQQGEYNEKVIRKFIIS